MNTLAEIIDSASVVVCCGPGGVGKTTTSAAIGIDAARRGRRVVVVTIDPARRLADALGLPGGLTGEPQRLPTKPQAGEGTGDGAGDGAGDGQGDGGGEVWAMMLDTPAMFERIVRRYAATADQADRIVANRFYRNMSGALSGTQEYMASEALHELHDDERFDLVIVDTPPSRNALDFLDAPGVLTRFLDHAVFKLLMMPTRTGFKVLSVATQPLLRAIGRVVGSDVLADAVAFFQAFAGMEAGFRQRAETVTRLLHDDNTKFVLVASPNHETIDEAMWFAQQLKQQGFGFAATIVNRVHPRFGDSTSADATKRSLTAGNRGDDALASIWQNLAELRAIADSERQQLTPLIERLGAGVVVEVPLLPTDVHDQQALTLLATHLFAVI